ncbi:GAF domain-containing protein [Streptomyces sp. ISL-22]|uniref:GAF domain-containing protein n=1 Tax=unclassified Streptomyces TaxID=2593676 RepID=UPI001BEC824B|nr:MULTISPECIES: GAF domain-containing protein [unclassified Streptomyces]MBT2418703.1 GAF domain-containing protein [Streptomyces sp. ISL-24]MBT2431328.1 GAF domain-containing protein [Streptomyces sp. ISL-22]
MAQTDEFGEELADFVRRVAELKAARSLSGGDLPTVLDAAIFELDHVADQLWPWYERLSSGRLPRTASSDRQEQHLLRAVFQRFPLPVALVDREAVVRRLNFAATSFTGVRAGYATGRPLTGFLAHADRAAFRSQAAAVARGEGDRSLTVHLQQRPSARVHATLAAVRPSGEPHTTVLVVLQPGDLPASGAPAPAATSALQVPDLTEATRHAALMDLLDEMTTTLLTAARGDREAVLRQAAQVLHGRFADWVIVDTGTVGTDTSGLSRTAVLAPSEEEAKALAAQAPTRCPLVLETARTGSAALQVRPADPDAFGHDPQGAPVLVQANVTSLLCVPLAVEGTVHGVLTLFRCGARLAFSMAEAQAMDMMSRHMSLAVAATS